MHFLPILSTLRRHRTAATLIVLEIALTCAIVCNALFVIGERLAKMDQDSGVVEDELVRIQLTGIGTQTDPMDQTRRDLAVLRALPGVKAAACTNMVPYGGSSWNNDVSTNPDAEGNPNAAMYLGSPGLRETFGARLIAGRDFTPDEYQTIQAVQSGQVALPGTIITQALADRLYPNGNALGQRIYSWGEKHPSTVIGIVDNIARPNNMNHGPGFAMFLPIDLPYTFGGNYVLRVAPEDKQAVLIAAEAALTKANPSRIFLERQTFKQIRSKFFQGDRAMAYLLFGVSLALLVITALGVVGLASFWVQQRTRQIGIRRALGATKRDIVRYFQLENFILATTGIVLGMGLAYAINLWLMGKYDIPRLPWQLLPIGASLLWFLGQIAVLGPALRAATIPPAIATRSV